MKKLSLFENFLFLINSVSAFLFLLSLVIPYVKPTFLSYFSILGLFSPIIITVNILFLFFWIAKLKRHFLLSLFVLLIGNDSVRNFINFSNNSRFADENKISLISYNVRLFNLYDWIKVDNVNLKIQNFLMEKNFDIICLQEYQNSDFFLDPYPYKYENLRGDKLKYGQAIFSKYPIISKGSLNFESRSNNAIFSDIKINNDTIRVYNVHLESFSLGNQIALTDMSNGNDKIFKNLSNTFIEQEKQLSILKKSISKSPHKVIVSGDFNNTAFSYVYKSLINNLKDCFKEKGNGFGITFNYNFIPLRIDFILIDFGLKVNRFKTYKIDYSDHEPIYSEIIF